jgi:hypothetical protein
MITEQVGREQIEVYLSVEEADALAEAAESARPDDKRKAALVRQATEQIRLLVGRVREAHRTSTNEINKRSSLRR